MYKPYVALEIATRTGELVPGSSIDHARPNEHAVKRSYATDVRDGAEHRLRPIKTEARDEVVLQSEDVVGIRHLGRGAIGVGVGGLVVQF